MDLTTKLCLFLPGERILASGSVQLPRFTLLESGSLLISPTRISDAGSYTCLATNSRGVDEASAELVVWGKMSLLFSSLLYRQLSEDLTIWPCHCIMWCSDTDVVEPKGGESLCSVLYLLIQKVGGVLQK